MDFTGLARTAEDLSSGGNFLITLPLRENRSNPQALVDKRLWKKGAPLLICLNGDLAPITRSACSYRLFTSGVTRGGGTGKKKLGPASDLSAETLPLQRICGVFASAVARQNGSASLNARRGGTPFDLPSQIVEIAGF